MFVRCIVLIVMTVSLALPVSVAPATATPDNFTPRAGVTFNSPTGDFGVRRAIFRKILRSIHSTPRGADIKFFTWNFLTRSGADALLRAQRRGVRVKVLMDDGNDTEIANTSWARLKRGLRVGNEGRPQDRRSWAHVCRGSCRGSNGSAHSKFFMFSEVGKAKRVVMQGSANFTLASTNNQWNDIFTHTEGRGVWDFASRIFKEAAQDRAADRPYAVYHQKNFKLMMFPHTRTAKPDPVMQLLRQVRCRGADNSATGRTVIRIAPDVIRKDRGMALARKVRGLWNDGCHVKIGYTVVGRDVGRYLRSDGPRGPVPMRHLVQDFDGDGEFDNYFHLKAMSIRGHLGQDRTGWAVLNGSANWSGLARVSDENLGIYYRSGLTKRYQSHLEYWYNNFPGGGSSSGRTTARTTLDDDQLIFGSGRNAVYEDGTSVTGGLYDPFAQMDELD